MPSTLAELAKTIRSKNAGVDKITFDVIFTDRYRLVAGENGRSLAGVSGNLGDWDGLLFLQR